MTESKLRRIFTVMAAIVLTLSVGVLGVWLLLSGQPGTGAMEHHRIVYEDGHHKSIYMGNHDDMHRAPSDRGIMGGYKGALGLIMLLVLTGLTGVLIYSLFREPSNEPRHIACWHCQRPVETDWETCPFCGSDLPTDRHDAIGRPPG